MTASFEIKDCANISIFKQDFTPVFTSRQPSLRKINNIKCPVAQSHLKSGMSLDYFAEGRVRQVETVITVKIHSHSLASSNHSSNDFKGLFNFCGCFVFELTPCSIW